MKQHVNLTLRALTPVCVGTGARLSAFTDYFLKGHSAVYVDQERVRAALRDKMTADPDLVKAYMTEITDSMNASGTRSEARLTDFLERRLGLPIDAFPERYPLLGAVKPDDKVQLYTMCRNGNAPYLPGSSLKGAFKTAVLYDRLTQTAHGKEMVFQLCSRFKENRAQYANLLKLRDDIAQKGTRANHAERETMKPLRKAVTALHAYFGGIENEVFGYKGPRYRAPFAGLLVRDSETLPASVVEIHCVQRLNLRDGSFGIPQLRECIGAGTQIALSVQLIPDFFEEAPLCAPLARPDGLQWLFAACDRFLRDNAAHDRKQCERQRADLPHPAQNAYSQFINDRLATPEPQHGCQLRIGAGKAYHYNAIGLAIHAADADAFLAMLQLFDMGEPDQKQYPVTRVLTDPGFVPLGWVIVARE